MNERKPVAGWKTDDEVAWTLTLGPLEAVVTGSPDSEPPQWAVYDGMSESDEPFGGDGGYYEGPESSVEAAQFAAEDALEKLAREILAALEAKS